MRIFFIVLLIAIPVSGVFFGSTAAADDEGTTWGDYANSPGMLNYKVPTGTPARTAVPGPPVRELDKPIRPRLDARLGHSDWKGIDYLNRIDSQLFDLSRQIQELVQQAKSSKRRIPPELRARIESLTDRESFVRQKLTDLRTASSKETWLRAKAELDRLLDELKVVLDVYRFRFTMFQQ